jgi:hypothetical protein
LEVLLERFWDVMDNNKEAIDTWYREHWIPFSEANVIARTVQTPEAAAFANRLSVRIGTLSSILEIVEERARMRQRQRSFVCKNLPSDQQESPHRSEER